MANQKKRQIGTVCEYSMDYIAEHSIVELIDKGKRFVIVNNSEEDDEVITDGDLPRSVEVC